MNEDDLRSVVQRQAGTIEALHAASAQLKARATVAEQIASGRLSDADAVRSLTHENSQLREENYVLSDRVRELEAVISRNAEATSLTAETQAQLGVQVRAYQRHNHFLQGEVSSRDSKMRAHHERVEFLQEEVATKERRVTVLLERLRQHNIDLSSVSDKPRSETKPENLRVSVPEATLQQIREKMAVQVSTIEVLRERLEALEDEASRKDQVLSALRRENDALKKTISKMVMQITTEIAASAAEVSRANDALRGKPDGDVSGLSATAGRMPHAAACHVTPHAAATPTRSAHDDDAEARLREFRKKRLQEFTAPVAASTTPRKR